MPLKKRKRLPEYLQTQFNVKLKPSKHSPPHFANGRGLNLVLLPPYFIPGKQLGSVFHLASVFQSFF